MKKEMSFTEQCRQFLEGRWKDVASAIESQTFRDPLEPEFSDVHEAIKACLTSTTRSYHYVLPTQLLSKCVDQNLDSHSLQAAYAKKGAFDARTIAHHVIVPFDQRNHRVLGGSAEPYVSNPLRCPAVIVEHRNQQKNKADWDRLVKVLDVVERTDSPSFTNKVFDQVLGEVYRLLSCVHVLYPTPNRVSLKQTVEVISQFVAERSGGERMLAVCSALFRAIADHFGLFDEIRRQKINAADAPSGAGADIECRVKDKIVLLVEVKDRSLTLIQLDAKLETARAKKISEILFLAEQGLEKNDLARAEERIKAEFATGQNVYVSDFSDFSSGILVLLGERGRVLFLSLVGEELDQSNSPIVHRQRWANLLKSI